MATTERTPRTLLRGGAWLIEPASADSVMTPERLTEEQRLIGQTTDQFVEQEVVPQLPQLEQHDWSVARRLIRRCAELDLLGLDVAEEYGGVNLDKVTSLIVSERMAASASFGATFGGQANLTVLPLFLFGTDAQKRKYLPKLLSGEIIGAYCLSETGSGSDALGAKTRAVRQADGSFVLNGEKMWITNGGFADIFIVFAKVDGEQFSAFIVERALGGVTSGKGEHEMRLHGSPTTALTLQDVKLPPDNLLGEVGKGHKVAFNVLNFGRFKLGGMCSGGARGAIGESAKYASQRKQFGQPIASFGAIKHKLGEMIVRTYALESLLYRTAGMIDDRIGDAKDGATAASVLEEYAVEASIAKVAGSETLNYVLDENIQIHGGNGFVRDYPAERHYRDARVNRIFEGTNEINRLLIPGMLARRAVKGDLALIPAARRLMDEVMAPPAPDAGADGPLSAERRAVAGMKKIALMVLGTAMQTYRDKLADEQEVLIAAADIMIDTYASESALLRASQSGDALHAAAALHADAARIFVNDAGMRIDAAARQALAATVEGDTLRTMLAALRRLIKLTPINTIVMRRRLADEAVARAGYIF